MMSLGITTGGGVGVRGGGASPHSQSPRTAIESSRALVTTAMVEAMFMLNKNDEIKV